MEVDARLKKAVIPNLQPDTSYDFKITAPEGNMGGLRHRITAKTSPPITIRRPEIDHTRETETTVTIILPSLETRSPVKYDFFYFTFFTHLTVVLQSAESWFHLVPKEE